MTSEIALRLPVLIAALVVALTGCSSETDVRPMPSSGSPTDEAKGLEPPWSLGGLSWDGHTLDLGDLAVDELVGVGDPAVTYPVNDGLVIASEAPLLSSSGGVERPSLVVFIGQAGLPSYVWTPEATWVLIDPAQMQNNVHVVLNSVPVIMHGGIGMLAGDHAWTSLTVSDVQNDDADAYLQRIYDELYVASGSEQSYLEWVLDNPEQIVVWAGDNPAPELDAYDPRSWNVSIWSGTDRAPAATPQPTSEDGG